MSNKFSFAIIFIFLIAVKAYSQNYNTFADYIKYNDKVKKLYNDIVKDNITPETANKMLDALKQSSLSNNDMFCELIDQILPKLIAYTQNNQYGLRKYFVNRGAELINTADSKLNDLSFGENTDELADSLRNTTKKINKEFNLSSQPPEQKGFLKTLTKDTTSTYTVKPGDNLWNIAKMKKENPFQWNEIYDNNKENIKNPDMIFPEQKLKISTKLTVKVPVKDTLQKIAVNKTGVEKMKKDSTNAADAQDPGNLGIGDLVIDHTQSKWGRDFVDLFNKYWNPPANIHDYTIIIEEKPLPRFGTVILIKVNGNYIYQRFIQPRYETIKANAEQGTQFALSYLENYNQIQRNLEGQDLKGTGIY